MTKVQQVLEPTSSSQQTGKKETERERGSDGVRGLKVRTSKGTFAGNSSSSKNPESAWLEVKDPKRQIARIILDGFAVVQRTHEESTCGSVART